MGKTYYVYLKNNLEKTGDYIIADSRLLAAKYFASKKDIDLKDWLNIFYVFNCKDLEKYLTSPIEFKLSDNHITYKFNKKTHMFELVSTNYDNFYRNKLTIKNFLNLLKICLD